MQLPSVVAEATARTLATEQMSAAEAAVTVATFVVAVVAALAEAAVVVAPVVKCRPCSVRRSVLLLDQYCAAVRLSPGNSR